MKYSLPSLREKTRYLLFEVIPVSEKSRNKYKDEDFSFQSVSRAILGSIKNYIGELGMARANPWLIQELYKTRDKKNGFIGVLKVERKYVDHVRASFLFINKINNEDVIVKSLLVSGSLKRIREEMKKI